MRVMLHQHLCHLLQIERLRATELTNATVSAEVTIKAAEAEAEAVRKRADAHLCKCTHRLCPQDLAWSYGSPACACDAAACVGHVW